MSVEQIERIVVVPQKLEREIFVPQGEPGEDGPFLTWTTLTQAAYDALTTEEQNDITRMFVIT